MKQNNIIRKRLVYLLKHNSVAQATYRLVFNGLFRSLGALVKFDPNLVMFVSMMGTKYSDSPKEIYEYLKNHAAYGFGTGNREFGYRFPH